MSARSATSTRASPACRPSNGVPPVADTGIRECTIMGQAIGLALRGLRPIAEIENLDYVPRLADPRHLRHPALAHQGLQKAPVIVRTRGDRLEGIWHWGSPMAGLLNLVRGIWVCVPRNMTQAAGFYNTLLESDSNRAGHRGRQRLPPQGEGALQPRPLPAAAGRAGGAARGDRRHRGDLWRRPLHRPRSLGLAEVGIEIEVIDVQTLLLFDLHAHRRIAQEDQPRPLPRRGRPGGGTAMMQKVVEEQGGYYWLDSEPCTLAAKQHRPSYGSDGDYFSKPNRETIFEAVYEPTHEAKPGEFPIFYR